ncbi:ankyrin repeat family protein [Orientia tsutsugamushi str. Gilliam]|uniref:Ankyrin repeat family protein n=1 Tax=Orientia tsutsugamushi str. Gilliam TaxID=1359184 RepID=A0A0F3M625_ORITS|nr:ankyrin repeat domain-containing protein [Orientia tsutsugamushi]KJV51195.1 ankyrin repeat family protein [Orientia tsutsugamushi str. Gilliam]SPR12817.1 ankyrin repeat-containing protein 16 [Orientia tsutsugamushi str. Gilliam]
MNNGNLLHDLYHAVRHDNIDDVQRILAQDMSLINSIHNALYNDGGLGLAVNGSALHTAVFYKRINIATFLFNIGANADVQDDVGFTPLHYALSRYDANMVMLLLNNGADPNVPSYEDCITPLHCVVTYNYYNTDRIELLVSRGGNIHAQKNNGRTVLHDAAEYGQRDIVEYLLARNANALLRDNSGKISAHFAAQYGYKDIVKLFLDKDYNIINLQDNDGQTVLHLAVLRHYAFLNREPNEEYIRYEERCFSMDERLDALGYSAEWINTMYDHGGIDFSLKNKDGYTVLDLALAIELDLATEHDQHKISNLLQEKRGLWRKEVVYNTNKLLLKTANEKKKISEISEVLEKTDKEKKVEILEKNDNSIDVLFEYWHNLPTEITNKILHYCDDGTLVEFQHLNKEVIGAVLIHERI